MLSQARQLNQDALGEIYDLYSSALYRYALNQLGDPAMAEECVAEVFSRLLHVLHKGRGPKDNLRAYLYRVAHNWITDTYRRPGPLITELNIEIQADQTEEPEFANESMLRNSNVRQAFINLTASQQQVVALRFQEGLKHKEIAKVMNKSIASVKALQNRAIATLQRVLLSEEQDNG